MTYQEIKRKHNLTDTEIAEMFGYKNASSFTNSSAKQRIQQGIEIFYNSVFSRSE